MTILYVILSLRVSFLFPLPVYYILQSVISYLMNLHIYSSLAILTIMPAASQGFLSIRSRYFWLTALWCMWHKDQFVRDSTDRLECCKFSLFCSLWFIKGNREWSAISFKLGCTITGRGWVNRLQNFLLYECGLFLIGCLLVCCRCLTHFQSSYTVILFNV